MAAVRVGVPPTPPGLQDGPSHRHSGQDWGEGGCETPFLGDRPANAATLAPSCFSTSPGQVAGEGQGAGDSFCGTGGQLSASETA